MKKATTLLAMMVILFSASAMGQEDTSETGYPDLDTVMDLYELMPLGNEVDADSSVVEMPEDTLETEPVEEILPVPPLPKADISTSEFLKYGYVSTMTTQEINALITIHPSISSIHDVVDHKTKEANILVEIDSAADAAGRYWGKRIEEDREQDIHVYEGFNYRCITHNSPVVIYSAVQYELLAPFVMVRGPQGLQTYHEYCKSNLLDSLEASEYKAQFIQWINEVKQLSYAKNQTERKLLEKIAQVMPEAAKLNRYFGDPAHQPFGAYADYIDNNQGALLEATWNEYLKFAFIKGAGFSEEGVEPMQAIQSFANVKDDFKDQQVDE